jgi:alpha-mannosidase
MHARGAEIEARLARVLDDRIMPAVHRRVAGLTLEVWHVPNERDGTVGEPVPFADAVGQHFEPAQVGDRWGPAWGTSWFRVTGQVPAESVNPEVVVDLGWTLVLPGFQAEALAYLPDGSPVKALNPRNNWLPASPVERFEWYLEAAANPTFGGFQPTREGDKLTASPTPLYVVTRAEVTEVDSDLRELAGDLDVLGSVMRTLGEEDPRRHEIALAVERALDAIDVHDLRSTAAQGRAELADVLSAPARASAHRVVAVGHAHIDSAWLWPVRETVRKVARTVANVAQLLDSTDDLVYAMSSAQQWEWLQQEQPQLFERVRKHVAGGRFVPVGGMWVESDTNMVGGEAMARQFVLGKRWFLDKLGVECEEVWLPDSFGYTAALPQIAMLAGCRWFLTQKMSWNTVDRFPHHTFWWEGIDGTRIFTHFPPVDTYTAELTGEELAHAAANFSEKGVAASSLIPFGYGDGGGGPTREMLGRARRTRDLDGSPRVSIASPRAFFEQAESEYSDAPVWTGELYLEKHRGTYTSQARTKQGNRRCEHLLREAELWATTAAVRGLLDYPAAELREAWKTVLLQQFHDILPGSSIAWVHREAQREYARVSADLERIVTAAVDALAGDGDETVAFNAGPFPRYGVPALGAAPVVEEPGSGPVTEPPGRRKLDNGLLRVSFDDDGVIRSVRDLVADREVVAPGGAADLVQLHPDVPTRWDAWDLDAHYRHRVTELTAVESFDIAAGTATVVRRFGGSRLTQQTRLRPGARQLDFETEVDWQESERVLKAAFDIDVHTDHTSYETQFGHVVRPTHVNTSWDAARFEVCAHRWVLVEEPGYGVAVANDSTYGHDVTRHPRSGGGTSSRLRLSLLRAPRFPDPEADRDRHSFRYALVPGADVLSAAAAGYSLNLPLRRGTGSPVPPLVTLDGPVLVEAVKLAEDGSGDVVCRLYEPRGGRAEAMVTAGFEAGEVTEVDLLERPLPPDRPHAWDSSSHRLRIGPFQIVTLRFARR